MNQTSRILDKVLRQAPGSIRELARTAGLSHVSLIQARDGAISLTPRRVQALIGALRQWGAKCAELADQLETTLEKQTQQQEEDHG